MKDDYAQLKLENQLCFPLYACSKEVVRQYKPFLDPLGLTYTQYITLLVLWEAGELSVKDMGERLWLDSGTLTPVLKKLEAKGIVTRRRSVEDERVVLIGLTPEGEALKEKAASIPFQVGKCIRLSPEEIKELHGLLYKVLESMSQDEA